MIFVPTFRTQMEAYRRQIKDQCGDHYESRLAQYRSVLAMYCVKTKKGVEDAARDFVGLIKGRGMWSAHIQAAIFAAALDVDERNMISIAEKRHRAATPATPTLAEDNARN